MECNTLLVTNVLNAKLRAIENHMNSLDPNNPANVIHIFRLQAKFNLLKEIMDDLDILVNTHNKSYLQYEKAML